MRAPVSDSEPSSRGRADRQPLAGGERRLDRPGARSGERRRRAGGGAGRGRRDGAVLRGLGRRLVRRLLLGREQEEPEQDDEEAERGREDQVLALVVHQRTFPSRRAWLGPGSTAGGPKGQGVIRSPAKSRRLGSSSWPGFTRVRARNRICRRPGDSRLPLVEHPLDRLRAAGRPGCRRGRRG